MGLGLNPAFQLQRPSSKLFCYTDFPLRGASGTILSRVWLPILFHSGIDEQCLRVASLDRGVSWAGYFSLRADQEFSPHILPPMPGLCMISALPLKFSNSEHVY